MAPSKFISVREAAQILSVSEKKIMDLIEERKLQAYKIADKFLRLKRDEVIGLKNTGEVAVENEQYPYTFAEKIKDFFYFNDFYIISGIIIIILLSIIFYN